MQCGYLDTFSSLPSRRQSILRVQKETVYKTKRYILTLVHSTVVAYSFISSNDNSIEHILKQPEHSLKST